MYAIGLPEKYSFKNVRKVVFDFDIGKLGFATFPIDKLYGNFIYVKAFQVGLLDSFYLDIVRLAVQVGQDFF